MPSRQFILTTFFIGLWYSDVRCHGLSDLQLSELSLAYLLKTREHLASALILIFFCLNIISKSFWGVFS